MNRIFSAGLVALLLVTIASVLNAPAAYAGTHRVCSTLPDGTVYCYVVKDPDPPPGGGNGDGGGTGVCKDLGKTISCAGPEGSWWDAGHQCYALAMNPPPPPGDTLWEGHTTGAVYRCLGGQGAGFFWSANGPGGPTPEELALRALAQAKAQAAQPNPGRYPAGKLRDGTPYTVVGPAYTWYWTTRASYQGFDVTASEGAVSATATVTPEALTFKPGDGNSAVSCAGPGSVFNVDSDGPWAPSPSGCQYRYPHSSIHAPNHRVTATYGIRWKVTWTGTGGVGGDLAGFETTSTSTFAVVEVEAVVTR